MAALRALSRLRAGTAGPLALTGAISAQPAIMGAATGLHGFTRMAYGAVCTATVRFRHESAALPTAMVLLGSAVLAQIALLCADANQPPEGHTS